MLGSQLERRGVEPCRSVFAPRPETHAIALPVLGIVVAGSGCRRRGSRGLAVIVDGGVLCLRGLGRGAARWCIGVGLGEEVVRWLLLGGIAEQRT